MKSFAMFVCMLAMGACGDDGGSGKQPDAAPAIDAAVDAAVDAPPPGSCGANGNGTVTGTVGGAMIAPVVRAQQIAGPGGNGFAIILDETAGACGMVNNTGEHLVLGFCAAPTVRGYVVVGEQAFMCPGDNTFGLIEQNGGMDFAESLSGSITITGRSATCISGTFDISFRAAQGAGNPEQASGSFNAIICP